MEGKQITTTQLTLKCYASPQVFIVKLLLMQPENANGADALPHELQEWYYQHSEIANIIIIVVSTKNLPYF